MNKEWLLGRKEIGCYIGRSDAYVTAMVKAGLKVIGGNKKGLEVRSKKQWVDDFIEQNPGFVASKWLY